VIAPFSGQWNDMMPAMAPDGSYLVFISTRPRADTAGAPRAANIYRSNWTATGWSQPVRLPDAVNIMPRIYRPTVAADGTIYFMGMTVTKAGRRMGLYRSSMTAGAYQTAVPLTFSDSTHNDVDPEIAPDQSYLVFSSADRGVAGDSHERLYLVTREGTGWGPIAPLHYEGDAINGTSDDNEARFGADHRRLYFASNRSMPVHFPRSAAQAREDLKRLTSWDNGSTSIWSIPFTGPDAKPKG
jgi:Tol biopolymer transport system component